jgi:hypothetical protein
MGIAVRDLLQDQNYANVVKERLKLPLGQETPGKIFRMPAGASVKPL